MKTKLKENHLPFLSLLPFCLMAASVVSYPMEGLAEDYELENGYKGQGLFPQPASGNSGNHLIIKGSLDPSDWIICAGYSSNNANSNVVISSWGDQEVKIKLGILGGYVVGYSNEETPVSASENEITLNKGDSPKVEVFGDIKAGIATGIGLHNAHQNNVNLSGIVVTGGVWGVHIQEGSGEATNNFIDLKESVVSNSVVGVLHGGNGNISNNGVTLSKTTVNGTYVVGGYLSGSGDVTQNNVTLNESVINGFVIGGHTTGSGSADWNTVNGTDTSIGNYVYGGYVNSESATGTASHNIVTLNHVKVNGDGVVGGYNRGSGGATNNRVTLINGSNVTKFVIGGYTTGLGSADWNIVDSTDTSIGSYVYGGFVDSTSARGTASYNTVKLENVEVGSGAAGGYYTGTGSEIVPPPVEGSNSNTNGSNSNIVKVTTSESKHSTINSFVVGGYVGDVGKNELKKLYWDANENNVSLTNTGGQLAVKGFVAGGFNLGAVCANSNLNTVTVKATPDPTFPTANIAISEYVVGGYIWGRDTGTTNNNTVEIITANSGSISVNSYVGGGFSRSLGRTESSHNTVSISSEYNPIEIGSYVFGGLLGAELDGNGHVLSAGVGSTNNNKVTIKNANVKTYIVGGYNQGHGRQDSSGTRLETNASENKVTLVKVTLEDQKSDGSGFNVDGHFVVGGLIENNGIGNATNNTVTISDSQFKVKYIAGGLSQGTGVVQENTVTLVNTDVEGFVAGGLDWYGKNVTLTNNTVSVTGGSVLGRVAGARSWNGRDVNSNSVYVQSAEIKAGGEYLGHILGAANQSGGNAKNNRVEVRDSDVDGYIAGGFIEHLETGLNNGSTDGNEVLVENSNVGGNIGGGYNQAGGILSASGNTVDVKILSTVGIKSFEVGGFIAGGIIGDKQKGAGTTNGNRVEIINSSSNNSFEIGGYVAGGYNGGVGEGGASGNNVLIEAGSNPSGSDYLITVKKFVLGGYVGSELPGARPKGDTSNNTVSVQNTRIATYVAGGYNLGIKGSANENKVSLKNVILYDGDDIDGHFVAGGLVGEGGVGDAIKNTVSVVDSSLKGKYLAGGVNQGDGLVDQNTTILTNTDVQGFVAGGLDWGERGNVTLTNNQVWMNGGSVIGTFREGVRVIPTGRVVGARSIGSGDVLKNEVHLKNVIIEDGVRGGVSAKKGNVNQNVVAIEDSEVTGWSYPTGRDIKGGTVVGGYVEGGNGNTNLNTVFIRNTNVMGNIVAGFNQGVGSSDSRNNTVFFEVDSSSANSSVTAGGFIAGGVTGMQSEGATNNNIVTIANTSSAAKINVKGYVAGGYNDGNGKGNSSGNTVILEAASPSSSHLTVESFVIGGYLRTGEGNTNNNVVQVKNATIKGSSSYVAGGLNEGTGRSENNVVRLENAFVEGGVLGGRVTGGSAGVVARNAYDSVTYQQEKVKEEDYIALVKNNVIEVSGNTKVYGRVAGGESLVGASDKNGPAIVTANQVVVNSGYIEGDIYGGLAVKANVCDNVINLNGGQIKGAVYGGFSVSGAIVSGNTVNLNGASGINLTEAWLFGRKRASTGTNGNTLNIKNFKGEMQNIGNFDRIDLDLAGLMVRENEPIILLTENQSTNLDNSTIHIHSSGSAIAVTDDSSLADRYEVIKNQSGSLTAFNVIHEKDKLVVVHERGTMEGLYKVEWDGYPDQIGDSIDLILERVEERPESGTYISNSLAWSRMHMRLHDRFGQAYYIDPFSGEERTAAGWVRQVGSHSHFRAGSDIKTHSRTAVTQIGADLIRNEFNEDVKSVWGIFAGGLYNRSSAKTYNSAQSRSDGYALGIYGTLYTGNSPDDGFYVDSWLLFGHYNNKIWSEDLANFRYKSNGWVWSVESGYTIPVSESGSKDFNKIIWTVQPEVQIVWDGVKANTAVDKDTETRFKQLGTNNISLRVGARLHANHINKGLGFIEGNWIHNTKKAGVQMGTGTKYIKGGRNLAEFRAGLEGHVSKNLLGWATVGVQAGQYGYHNETAQIGLKYMF